MGAGIAQLALENGHQVVLHDIDDPAIERGRARIAEGLTRRAVRLELDADSTEQWVAGRLAALRDAHSLDAVGAEAEVVIEAALEELELKQTVFATLDAAATPETILATNTSALSVAAIAARAGHPERVIGLHFFNPAPVMPLVEVVVPPGVGTAVVERANALIAGWGKTAVHCADTPGFIVNRVNRPFTIEALRILESGLTTVDKIDAAIRAAGFPMGPFELMDFVGIDINLAAAIAIWDGLGRPERLRPSTIQRKLVAAGELGRKTGLGFYHHDGANPIPRSDLGGVPVAPRPGLIGPAAIVERILGAIDTEAELAVAGGVASAVDIDLALRLGAGHPERSRGPETG